MNVVDATGWIEYLSDGPDAAFVAQTLQETDRLLVPTVTLQEVFARVCREHGESAALQVAATMQQGKVVELDSAAALDAARLTVELGVPDAAGPLFAAARRHDATVWTLDERLRHVEGVRYRAPAPGRRAV